MGHVVRMRRGLGQRQHRREARVGALEQVTPVRERPALEHRRQPRLAVRPGRRLRLAAQQRGLLVGEADPVEQLGVELRLTAADRDVPPVGGLVDVVERRAEVEDVAAGHVGPQAFRPHTVEERGQQRHPVDHRGVDHLAAAGQRPLDQGAEDAHDDEHAAAAVVAEQVERRRGRLPVPAQRVERARQRDVVDVMAGGARVGALAPPAADPRVHQPWVAGLAVLGAEPEPLGDAGAEALEQHVGPVHQPEHRRRPVRVLEVDRDRPPSAGDEVKAAMPVDHPLHRVLVRAAGRAPAGRASGGRAPAGRAAGPNTAAAGPHIVGPRDPDHVRAQVGQHHRGERPRPPTLQLDDPHACQRSGHVSPPVSGTRVPSAQPASRQRNPRPVSATRRPVKGIRAPEGPPGRLTARTRPLKRKRSLMLALS